MYKIAIVDDEKHILDILSSYLIKAQFNVFTYSNVEDVLKNYPNDIDLWVLDIMLPGKSGYDLVDEIKAKNSETPVIFISARDQDFDKIFGLERGGDDYIAKPFSPKELVLRVQKLLQRTYKNQNSSLKVEPYEINLQQRLVFIGTENIDLTTKEYNLLLLLIKHPNQPFTREQILNQVWEPNYFGSDRVVDDLMRRLRKKMPELRVETVYGFGYRFVTEV